jgi:hypothetical protein
MWTAANKATGAWVLHTLEHTSWHYMELQDLVFAHFHSCFAPILPCYSPAPPIMNELYIYFIVVGNV